MRVPEPVRPTLADEWEQERRKIREDPEVWRAVEAVMGDEIPFTASLEPPHRRMTRTELRTWPADKLREVRAECVRWRVNPYLEYVCEEILRERAAQAGSE
jgi:hypothetical protein